MQRLTAAGPLRDSASQIVRLEALIKLRARIVRTVHPGPAPLSPVARSAAGKQVPTIRRTAPSPGRVVHHRGTTLERLRQTPAIVLTTMRRSARIHRRSVPIPRRNAVIRLRRVPTPRRHALTLHLLAPIPLRRVPTPLRAAATAVVVLAAAVVVRAAVVAAALMVVEAAGAPMPADRLRTPVIKQ